ncbi:MAG: exo-alpha-sialidase [Candidatus Omnitrophica bacterium]|nr:exo-alpha-sialidase [Candidatus Omnitrophota bacterium]
MRNNNILGPLLFAAIWCAGALLLGRADAETATRNVNPEKCPDNIWDESEQQDPALCPEDNPAQNPNTAQTQRVTTTPSLQKEFLDNVSTLTVVETWKFEYAVNSGGAFVPDIAEYHGKFYMYAFKPLTGIVSFSSVDGKTWTNDAGARVNDGHGWQYSHPYAAIAPDGQLYLFMQTMKQGGGSVYYVSRSESSDGLNFTDPEAAITPKEIEPGVDVGVAHGRILKLDDGNYLLAVSAGYAPADPRSWAGPGSRLAYSADLKSWDFSPIYFAGCHDPTFDKTSDGIRLYCHFQAKQTLRFDSPDGYQWDSKHPAGRVEFLDRNGAAINGEDIDIHSFSDGTKRMFISLHPKGPPWGEIWSTVKK